MELEFRLREDAKRAKALTDENRLAILAALRQGEKCGCTLMSELNITQPTLSHHMRILCDSSLVSCRKDGKWTIYSISPEGVKSFLEMVSSYTGCEHDTKKTAAQTE